MDTVRLLARRLCNHDRLETNVAEAQARCIVSNAEALPHNLSNSLRSHLFLIVRNALNTRMRNRYHVKGNLMCGLCGKQEETLEHLHRACPVSISAVRMITENTPLMYPSTILLSANPSDFLFSSSTISAADQLHLLTLSLAIWRVRNEVVNSRQNLNLKGLAVRVYREFKKHVKPAFKALGVEKDKSEQRIAFNRLLLTLPPKSYHIYTDGSSHRETSETGAGFAVVTNRLCSLSSSHYVGKGTNNTAEIWAVIYALRHVIRLITLKLIETIRPVFVFTDSKYVLDLINNISTPRTNLILVQSLSQEVSRARELSLITFHKVPGHAHVYGNEIADALAKRGAKGITSTFNLPQHIMSDIHYTSSAFASRDENKDNPVIPTSKPNRCRKRTDQNEALPAPKRHDHGMSSTSRSRCPRPMSTSQRPPKKPRLTPFDFIEIDPD